MANLREAKNMELHELFVSMCDTDSKRVCGTCGKLKPFKEFYKDGTDRRGNVRYRRDCKECYKKTRIQTEEMKSRRH